MHNLFILATARAHNLKNTHLVAPVNEQLFTQRLLYIHQGSPAVIKRNKVTVKWDSVFTILTVVNCRNIMGQTCNFSKHNLYAAGYKKVPLTFFYDNLANIDRYYQRGSIVSYAVEMTVRPVPPSVCHT